ncbi:MULTISPECIES: YncE family protein [unclassified Polaribacter]|uniref:YncE family protein n=1 Tax=unclassified Polaribacter TaxID=196858 RepID=UPI0011BEB621|nr:MULTISPECIES: cell surface protein [unclassified Polaribacter]TXD52485.1 cell surface protein [Polaribacter sp. IC063]TXD60471.1 cell surface protein [Polaribacter sp. IC066]
MKITKSIFKLFLLSLVFTACNDETAEIPEVSGRYDNGLIVSAEGAFGNKDGSISYVNNDLNRLATNFMYTGVNNAQLGGLVQSIAFTDTEAYVVLNDVNTIVVVDRFTFKKVTEIRTGLSNPRYMAFANGKGYVTNWGSGSDTTDDYLAVIDVSTNTIESTKISLDNGVERIVAKNSKLYVSHKGAFTSNNIISVVDVSANNAVAKIIVKDNPDELLFDVAGNLIVLSEGRPLSYGGAPDYAVLTSTTSSISFINVNDNTVTKEITFNDNERATQLSYNNGNVYYYMGSEKTVFSINESDTMLATDGISTGSIYGMAVKDNNLYTVSYNFTSLSKLIVTDLSSKQEIYTSPVGLGASKIYFN